MFDRKNIAIILLAAGSSSRLGRPKQLLKINGSTLINKMVDAAIGTGCHPVVIVLGAYFDRIKNAVNNKVVKIIENKDWEDGMGGSISCGMNYFLDNFPKIDAVILMVCDQPYLNKETIDQLIINWGKTQKNIVACKYGNTVGVPALFSKKYFQQLNSLSGKTGAKNILLKNKEEITTIDFPKGIFDLDTEEDVNKIIFPI